MFICPNLPNFRISSKVSCNEYLRRKLDQNLSLIFHCTVKEYGHVDTYLIEEYTILLKWSSGIQATPRPGKNSIPSNIY